MLVLAVVLLMVTRVKPHVSKSLADFKAKQINVLVATDVAARGIDIAELRCVINLDLPNVAKDYVHIE